MIDKAIVTAMGVVFTVILFVSMITMMITTVQKINFDQICRTALYELDFEGGLSVPDQTALRENLVKSGYSSININAPTEVQYGNLMNITVTAQVKTSTWKALLIREAGVTNFKFSRTIVSRKIHNSAY